ncbi:hypothetical protein DFJ77DRAFT_111634 [Powellomyces hirtus]|nr:hypothetical protein DFJ77DRAFT_111634 [Powellomyces hirtus]
MSGSSRSTSLLPNIVAGNAGSRIRPPSSKPSLRANVDGDRRRRSVPLDEAQRTSTLERSFSETSELATDRRRALTQLQRTRVLGRSIDDARTIPRRRLLLPPRETPLADSRVRAGDAQKAKDARNQRSTSSSADAQRWLPSITTPGVLPPSTGSAASAAEQDVSPLPTPGIGGERPESVSRRSEDSPNESTPSLDCDVTEHRSSMGQKYVTIRMRSQPESGDTLTKPRKLTPATSVWRLNSAGNIVRSAIPHPEPVIATLCCPLSRSVKFQDPSFFGFPNYAAPFAPSHPFGFAPMLSLDDPFFTMVSDASYRRLSLVAAMSMEPGKATSFVPLPLLRLAAMTSETAPTVERTAPAPLSPPRERDISIASTLRSVEMMRTLLDSMRPLHRLGRSTDSVQE